MIKGSDILGLPVINKKNGEKIAEVKSVLYSKKKFRAMAFLLNGKGLFKEPEIVRYNDIESIGKDAIIVKDKRLVEKSKKIPEVHEIILDDKSIIGMEIIAEDGESIGFIHDVVLDDKKGKILGFILTDGVIQDIMDGRCFLPYMHGINLGKDTLLINSKIKENFIKNKEEYKKFLELE